MISGSICSPNDVGDTPWVERATNWPRSVACPIWVVAYMDYDKDIHASHAFADPRTAEALHYRLISAAEAGRDGRW